MGDRANIVIRHQAQGQFPGGCIWLYTHHGGHGLPLRLQKALAKQWRWADPSYLTRIIYDELSKGHHGAETSFGISLSPADNSYHLLLVDTAEQTVKLLAREYADRETGARSWKLPEHPPSVDRPVLKCWTYQEYVDLELDAAEPWRSIGIDPDTGRHPSED